MRQTTKEKQRQWRWAHRRSSRLDWNNVLGPVPRELLSCVSLTPTVSVTTTYFLLHFFSIFRPPVLYYGFYYLLFDLMHRREFLISVIRLTYSEGDIYLLVCLFACFSPPKFNSRINSAFRFEMVRQSETSIYYGVIFYYKNETKKYENKKKWFCSIGITANRVSWVGYRIGSAAGEQWVGLAGFDFLMDGEHSFLIFLACLLACFLDWICLLCCCCLSLLGDLTLHLSAILSFRTYYIPWSRLLLSCGILVLYLHILHIISLYHLIWYDMTMDFALSVFFYNDKLLALL